MQRFDDTIWLFLRKMRTPLIVLNLAHAIPVLLLTMVPGVDSQGNPYNLTFFDAVYIVAYTATTIGFGELPYTFTYLQRFVMIVTIYVTVIAWFYAIGNIVSLLQDKVFLNAVRMNAFRRKVRRLKQDFIIICGYNNVSRLLIESLIQQRLYRIVVIDRNSEKIEELEMQEYIPPIPSISADASSTDVLKSAGIESENCRFIVALFDDDQLNLKISVRARILNKKIKIIAKSSVSQGVQNLYDIGVDKVIDPFERVANRIDFAMRSPYLFALLDWVNGGNLNINKSDLLPRGKYIVCSRGRFGKTLQGVLERNGIENVYLDINKDIQQKQAADRDFFIQAGIHEASCIIAGTNDDAINLSIVVTARMLKPDIFVMVRENKLEERSMFAHLRVEKIFILDRIMAINAYNYISRPLADLFLSHLGRYDDQWGRTQVSWLIKTINKKPQLIERFVNHEDMLALSQMIKERPIQIADILQNPYGDSVRLRVVVMALKRKSGEFLMVPDETTLFEEQDELLLAGTNEDLERFDMIVNNYNELFFVLNKKEPKSLLGQWIMKKFPGASTA